MAMDFFHICARFYYHLLRLLRFNDLYYNGTLKCLQNQPRNPRLRRYILRIYYTISGIYAAIIIGLIVSIILTLWETPEQFTSLQLVSIAYVFFIQSVYISTFYIISYQLQSKRTSKFLRRFFNELFHIQRNIRELTGRCTILDIHMKLLLLFKLILIVWILIVSLNRFSFSNNCLAFPVFELAYIANYAIIIKLLSLQEDLRNWLKYQVNGSPCTADCKKSYDMLREAITLWTHSGQLFSNFLKYFAWYEKLVLLENIYCIYLSSQFIVCVFYKQYYNGAMLPDLLNHILNILLIGMANDTLKCEEDSLKNILTVLVAKLSHQRRLYRDLLKAIDVYFCCRHMRPYRINIFGSYWTREFAIDVFQNLLLLGVSITQFGSDMIYYCNYDPDHSNTL